MKPNEKKPETVYRIIDKRTGEVEGVYSRACCDEYDFNSAQEARDSHCRGIYRNKDIYRIAKYKVTYELIDDNCDK